MTKPYGKIILAGAGPGDPELMTLRCVRALREADVVLYDALVSPQIVQMANPAAELICVGKKGYGQSCRQDDINRQMVELAQSGKCVLRLKGGDALIFSRAAEELDAARAAHIPIEIIPGITAAQSAAAALGIPLTHRETARRLQFVTGHDHKGALPDDINWPALADPHATTVVYMAKKTLPLLAQTAIAHGLPATTPAVAVFNASHETQRIIGSTIETLPAILEDEDLEGPVVVIIGDVLNRRS